MSDIRNYYYIRIKEDFFDNDEIKIIEAQPNGYKYSNILIKLYLKSLKAEGKLMINDYIPYNIELLSKILGHDIDTVRNAIKLFESFGLIEILDNGAIFMLNIQQFIGKSSTEADRKKSYRMRIEKEKALLKTDKCPDKCLLEKPKDSNRAKVKNKTDKCPDKIPPELELEIKLEIELELQLKVQRLLSTDKHQAAVVIKEVMSLHKDKDVLTVIKEKWDIVSKENYSKPFGALVKAIREDWKRESSSSKKSKDLKFNNFEARDYDYDALERKLLGWDKDEE